MITYTGLRPGRRSTSVRYFHPHSPTYNFPVPHHKEKPNRIVFDWGCKSDQTDALAHALLLHVTSCPTLSRDLAPAFAAEVVSTLPALAWQMTEMDILRWIAHAVEEQIHDDSSAPVAELLGGQNGTR